MSSFETSMEQEYFGEALLFPKIPDGKRIIPNDIIRSALFTVSNHNQERAIFKKKEIHTFGDTKITYTGEELRQDDEDVWLQIIYLCSKNQSDVIEFKPYTLLKNLDWPGRTQYCEKLKDSIERMNSTALTISNKVITQALSLSMIRKFVWRDEDDKKLRHWKVWLEPEIVKLFSNMTYSKIIWQQRKQLKPLAKWLHAYYSSHAEPFPLKLNTILNASGSKTKNLKHFKPLLNSALAELIQVGFLDDYWIKPDGLVFVTRKKSKSLLNGTLYA